MEKDPIQNDVRRARRERKFGKGAVCVLCGETDVNILTMVRRSLIQDHHIAGEANDPDSTVPLCLNCHAKESAGQLARGVPLRHNEQGTSLEVLQVVLQEVGLFLQALGASLLAWAERLGRLIGGLDDRDPGWRELDEAKL